MRIEGVGKAFIGSGDGDWYSLGQVGDVDTTAIFELSGGECMIPEGTVNEFTKGLLDASVTFSGSFDTAVIQPRNWGCYWEVTGPDKDGWEPRMKWDR